jgi:hypothetical protein
MRPPLTKNKYGTIDKSIPVTTADKTKTNATGYALKQVPKKVKGKDWLDTVDDVMSAPQKAATYAIEAGLYKAGVRKDPPKYESPSDGLGISEKDSPWIKMGVDMLLDPTNLLGIGLASKASKIAKGAKILKKSDNIIGTLDNGNKVIGTINKTKNYKGVTKAADWQKNVNNVITFPSGKKVFTNMDDITNFNKFNEAVELGVKDGVGSVTVINDLINQDNSTQPTQPIKSTQSTQVNMNNKPSNIQNNTTTEVKKQTLNKDLKDTPKTNFEQRIQNPVKQINNSDGTSSTHRMMSFEADGKYYAAPTIVEKNGKLIELSEKDAIDYAFKNNEFKEFKTDQEAKNYAKGDYKINTPLEQPKKDTGKSDTYWLGDRWGSYNDLIQSNPRMKDPNLFYNTYKRKAPIDSTGTKTNLVIPKYKEGGLIKKYKEGGETEFRPLFLPKELPKEYNNWLDYYKNNPNPERLDNPNNIVAKTKDNRTQIQKNLYNGVVPNDYNLSNTIGGIVGGSRSVDFDDASEEAFRIYTNTPSSNSNKYFSKDKKTNKYSYNNKSFNNDIKNFIINSEDDQKYSKQGIEVHEYDVYNKDGNLILNNPARALGRFSAGLDTINNNVWVKDKIDLDPVKNFIESNSLKSRGTSSTENMWNSALDYIGNKTDNYINSKFNPFDVENIIPLKNKKLVIPKMKLGGEVTNGRAIVNRYANGGQVEDEPSYIEGAGKKKRNTYEPKKSKEDAPPYILSQDENGNPTYRKPTITKGMADARMRKDNKTEYRKPDVEIVNYEKPYRQWDPNFSAKTSVNKYDQIGPIGGGIYQGGKINPYVAGSIGANNVQENDYVGGVSVKTGIAPEIRFGKNKQWEVSPSASVGYTKNFSKAYEKDAASGFYNTQNLSVSKNILNDKGKNDLQLSPYVSIGRTEGLGQTGYPLEAGLKLKSKTDNITSRLQAGLSYDLASNKYGVSIKMPINNSEKKNLKYKGNKPPTFAEGGEIEIENVNTPTLKWLDQAQQRMNEPLTQQQVESFVEYYVPIAKKYNLSMKDIITHQMIAPGRKPDITDKEYQRILKYMKDNKIN